MQEQQPTSFSSKSIKEERKNLTAAHLFKELEELYVDDNTFKLPISELICRQDSANKKSRSMLDISLHGAFLEEKHATYVNYLAGKLNEIHNTEYSLEFWRRAFTIQMYRSIHALHYFYITAKPYLQKYECTVQKAAAGAIKIPHSFEDQRKTIVQHEWGQELFLSLLAEDMGYRLNANQTIIWQENSSIKEEVNARNESSFLSISLIQKINKYSPQKLLKKVIKELYYITNPAIVAVTGCLFDHEWRLRLTLETKGKVRDVSLPRISFTNEVDYQLRKHICETQGWMDDFDRFYFKCMVYLLPTIIIEDFDHVYRQMQGVFSRYPKLRFIASEDWMGSSQIGLFRAIGMEEHNIKTVAVEHNCFFHPFEGGYFQHLRSHVDRYLTLGWESPQHQVEPAGSLFSFKAKEKEAIEYPILFVGYGICRYSEINSSETAVYGVSGADFALRSILFFKNLDSDILSKIYYRGYPKDYFIRDLLSYDFDILIKPFIHKSHMLVSSKEKGFRCTDQMCKSGLVIFSYLSTAYIECLHMNIPCIVIVYNDLSPLNSEFASFYDELIEAGVIQTSWKEAVSKVQAVYENPLIWWDDIRNRELRQSWLTRNFKTQNSFISKLATFSH